ncbi:MAG: glycosyltransferase [Hyphomonadaceae bacterium]
MRRYTHAMLKLSIITPVHNAARFIAETAASVVAQLGEGDEYIVVDDGSTDTSVAALGPYRERITLLQQANQGEIAAVNRGVAAARHEVVGVINADDPILPGLLDAMRAAFAAAPDLAGAYPDWRRIDDRGRTLAEIRTREFSQEALICEHHCLPGPGAFFRPGALGGEPPRDPRAHGISDYDMWLRLSLKGRIVRVPRTLATWRSHGGASTFTLPGGELARTKIAAIERFFARDDLPAEMRAWRPRALSAAYYNAALLGLRHSGVPAWRYALASYAARLTWPRHVPRQQRRSLTRLLYASLQPAAGSLHEALSPLLPPRFSRRAVLEQTFATTPQPPPIT